MLKTVLKYNYSSHSERLFGCVCLYYVKRDSLYEHKATINVILCTYMQIIIIIMQIAESSYIDREVI